MASPTQLAILFYDILKVPVVDKKQPRATGEDALIALAEKTDLNICKLLVERRGLVKLLSTYIDNIPQLVNFWGDGKIRTHFKQYGAKTGRFSSGGSIKYVDDEGHNREISGVNAQNIPAHLKELRMQFMADISDYYIDANDDYYEVPYFNEVETLRGWIPVDKLLKGDVLILNDGNVVLSEIIFENNIVKLKIESEVMSGEKFAH